MAAKDATDASKLLARRALQHHHSPGKLQRFDSATWEMSKIGKNDGGGDASGHDGGGVQAKAEPPAGGAAKLLAQRAIKQHSPGQLQRFDSATFEMEKAAKDEKSDRTTEGDGGSGGHPKSAQKMLAQRAIKQHSPGRLQRFDSATFELEKAVKQLHQKPGSAPAAAGPGGDASAARILASRAVQEISPGRRQRFDSATHEMEKAMAAKLHLDEVNDGNDDAAALPDDAEAALPVKSSSPPAMPPDGTSPQKAWGMDGDDSGGDGGGGGGDGPKAKSGGGSPKGGVSITPPKNYGDAAAAQRLLAKRSISPKQKRFDSADFAMAGSN